jgi:hypothetical protein
MKRAEGEGDGLLKANKNEGKQREKTCKHGVQNGGQKRARVRPHAPVWLMSTPNKKHTRQLTKFLDGQGREGKFVQEKTCAKEEEGERGRACKLPVRAASATFTKQTKHTRSVLKTPAGKEERNSAKVQRCECGEKAVPKERVW